MLRKRRVRRGRRRPEESLDDVARPTLFKDDIAIKCICRRLDRSVTQASSLAGALRVSRLPLFVVVGPAHAGKSSLLQNLGFTAHLVSEHANGDSGSEIGNVWLINNVTFLEVDGQFFDSDPIRFATLMRALRRSQFGGWSKLLGRSPWHLMRGLILVLDVNEFIGVHDPSKLHRTIKQIRDRLCAAGEEFGGCPVYVVFAKTDAVPYFAEFVSGMAEHDCSQVFGVLGTDFSRPTATERQSAETETKKLNDYFNSLLLRLNDRRLLELFREIDPGTKRAIYEFPREFRRLGSFLAEFLVGVFAPSTLIPLPFLRGFFFSGIKRIEASDRGSEATALRFRPQESVLAGEATAFLRRDVGDLLKSVRSPRAEGDPAARMLYKWVFTRDVFEKVLALDRPAWFVANVELQWRRRRRWAQGVAVSLGLCFGVAWTISWIGNRSLIGTTETAILGVQRTSDEVTLSNLSSLEVMRKQLSFLSAPKGWSLHSGLYTGERLLPVARYAYFQRLNRLILSRLQNRLHARLLGLESPQDLQPFPDYFSAFETLRTYLFMSGSECFADRDEIHRALDNLAHLVFPSLGQDENLIISNQLEFYAKSLVSDNSAPPVALGQDDHAVTLARAYLQSVTGSDQQLRSLLNEINTQTKPLIVEDVIPDFRTVLSGFVTVDGAFTKPGRAMFENRLATGTWSAAVVACVMGGRAEAPKELLEGTATVKVLRSLYYREYADRWRRILADTRVNRYSGPVDAAKRLKILSGPNSPILEVLRMVARNTEFSFEGTDGAQTAEWPPVSAYDVTRLFQPVLFMTPPQIDFLVNDNNVQYVEALRNLRESLDSLARSSPSQSPAAILAVKDAVARAMLALDYVTDKFADFRNQGLNRELGDFLAQPIRLAKGVIPR